MDISLEKLEEAVTLRRKIDLLEKRFGLLFRDVSPGVSTRKGRRGMSAAARAKIAAAQRARWAKVRSSQTVSAPPRKGGITPAGRRKLSLMMKRRWAERKKAAARKT
jgi:hypothetical protein